MLSQNVAKRFGFKENPFDTSALSLNSESLLPISKAFVGRDMSSIESKTLTNVLRLAGGNRFIIEGEVGVGKTTFINYHRYLWENESHDKLFTHTNEISFDPSWTAKDFLINILSVLIKKVVDKNSEKILRKNTLLKKIFVLCNVYQSSHSQWQGSVLGFGGIGYGKNEVITIPELSEAQLFIHFQELVNEIKKMGYVGLFIHIDNFEKVAGKDTKKMQEFFHLIRDILQTKSVYFAFVGYPGFYKEIIHPIERVRSIFFNLPIYLPPLSQKQVLEVITKRYQLLSNGEFIKPVEKDFICYLYQLYGGKIRSILDSLSTLIVNIPENICETISIETAREILVKEMRQRVGSMLSTKAVSVLEKIALEKECTNAQIAKKFKQQPQSIFPVIKELEKLHFIYTTRSKGRQVFYKVDDTIKILQKQIDNVKCSKSLSLSNTQKTFIEFLEEKEKVKLKEFCEAKKISINHARNQIKILLKHNLIQKHGYTKGLFYTKVIKTK